MKEFNKIICNIKCIFSIANIRQTFTFLFFISFLYVIFLTFSPRLSPIIQNEICRISGIGVIFIMFMLLALFFYALKLIKNTIIKLGIIGCVGTIIMYSLWLIIDYGSKHPYASATGFNVPEITLGLACGYLLLDKIQNCLKNNKNNMKKTE